MRSLISHTMYVIATVVLAAGGTACVAQDDPAANETFDALPGDSAADDAFSAATRDGKEDGALTYVAVARVALAAGLECTGERIALAVAIARAESGFHADATNTAGNSHGVDRGLWQINSYFQPNVSRTCAFSPSCNARAMVSISSQGTHWRAWWTYVNGKHLPYMPSALSAQTAVCGG